MRGFCLYKPFKKINHLMTELFITEKVFLSLAALNGFIAVALGAFGAHGLRDRLTEHLLSAWQTAVQYHFYHTLALLAVALLLPRFQFSRLLIASGWLFVAGILLFSGSLYGLALGGPKILGPVTPLGGLCFLLGWLVLFIAVVKV